MFDFPTIIPPGRKCNLHIPLVEGTTTIKSIPYRYPHFQKQDIERQVNEILDQGIVQHNNSRFSSLDLLVKKHDDSWKMCVNYKNLNRATMEHHFSIPIINELPDELVLLPLEVGFAFGMPPNQNE